MSLKAFHTTMSQLLIDLEAIDLGINIEIYIVNYSYENILSDILADEAQLNEQIKHPFDDCLS
jgi:hypothetical protein